MIMTCHGPPADIRVMIMSRVKLSLTVPPTVPPGPLAAVTRDSESAAP